MITADSLNLDILEQIFSFLSSNDLASVALVSSSFFWGVIPRLYRTLSFRIQNAKQYPNVSTAFSALLAHPGLAVHVRNIDIRATPSYKGQVHPDFLKECTQALDLCNNLLSFVYTPDSTNVLLPVLQNKARLRDLRVTSKFTSSHAESLAKLDNVEKVALDWASREVLYVLPDWAGRIRRSLTSLTLFMSADLNFEVLEQTLKQLPDLLALHVIGSPAIPHSKVLALASHTRRLESLAFTVTGTAKSSYELPNPDLSRLKHLALDVRFAATSATLAAVLMSIQSFFPALTSVAFRLPEVKADDIHSFVSKVIDGNVASIKRVVFVDVAVELRTIKLVCERCKNLEVLQLPFQLKDLRSFINALAVSPSLRTLIDGDAHVTHGPKPNLGRSNASYMMHAVRKLTRIVTDRRVWSVTERDKCGHPTVSLERHTMGSSTYWFMPPSTLT